MLLYVLGKDCFIRILLEPYFHLTRNGNFLKLHVSKICLKLNRGVVFFKVLCVVPFASKSPTTMLMLLHVKVQEQLFSKEDATPKKIQLRGNYFFHKCTRTYDAVFLTRVGHKTMIAAFLECPNISVEASLLCKKSNIDW